MKVYLLHIEWNHHGDTINEIKAVYDNIKKAQKSILEEWLDSIKHIIYKSMNFLDKDDNIVYISYEQSIMMENMFYDDDEFYFPVNRIELITNSEDYCYLTIEEKELL